MEWNDYLLNRWNKMSLECCFSMLLTRESLEDQYCSGQQRSDWAMTMPEAAAASGEHLERPNPRPQQIFKAGKPGAESTALI